MSERMRWHEVLDRIPVDREVVGVEVGVWIGELSEKLLSARPNLTLHLVDLWTKESQGKRLTGKCPPDEAYARVREIEQRFPGRVILHRKASVKAARQTTDHSLDFVFIDAKHSYTYVKQDIREWKGKVRPGGWIGGHDYGNGPHQEDPFPGVRQAVNEVFGKERVQTGADYCWFVELE